MSPNNSYAATPISRGIAATSVSYASYFTERHDYLLLEFPVISHKERHTLGYDYAHHLDQSEPSMQLLGWFPRHDLDQPEIRKEGFEASIVVLVFLVVILFVVFFLVFVVFRIVDRPQQRKRRLAHNHDDRRGSSLDGA